VESLDTQRRVCDEKLAKVRRCRIDADIHNEESSRMARLVDRTRDTMRRFR
jgi:hypothetical protein